MQKNIIVSFYGLFLFLLLSVSTVILSDSGADTSQPSQRIVSTLDFDNIGTDISEIEENIVAPMARIMVGEGRFEDPRLFTIDFSGELFLETFYDARQVRGFTEDEIVFFPLPRSCDSRGQDINDKDQFSMIAVRIAGCATVNGPEIGGAKTSVVIKGGFEGLGRNVFSEVLSDLTVRLFKLKKGVILFEWDNTRLLMGHFYHPIVLNYEEIFADTVGKGGGNGYDPFAYAPQIAVRHRISNVEFIFALAKLFAEERARWAVTPDLFMQINGHIREHICGVGINYHVIVPRLEAREDPMVYKETAQLGSIAPFAFIGLQFDSCKIRSRLSYIQNGGVFTMMGDPFVLSRNPITDERFWANSGTVAFWTDFAYCGHKVVELGLFTGISKNVGSPDYIQKGYETKFETCQELITGFMPGGINVADYMFVCAPRIRLKFGNFTVGGEIEYARAAFAKSASYSREEGTWSLNQENSEWLCDFDSKGRVVNACPVSNFRLLVATSYAFA